MKKFNLYEHLQDLFEPYHQNSTTATMMERASKESITHIMDLNRFISQWGDVIDSVDKTYLYCRFEDFVGLSPRPIRPKFVALEKASGDPDKLSELLKNREELGHREILVSTEIYEAVNSPKHYSASKIEVIDIIDSILESQPELSAYQGFLLGNVIKYVSRLTLKEKPKQDANKAKWYLERLIDVL